MNQWKEKKVEILERKVPRRILDQLKWRMEGRRSRKRYEHKKLDGWVMSYKFQRQGMLKKSPNSNLIQKDLLVLFNEFKDGFLEKNDHFK